MRHCVIAVFVMLTGCIKPIERSVKISAVEVGNDYGGLSDYEKREFDWAAIDAKIPADVIRSIRHMQSTTVNMLLFRCDQPQNYYPAYANINGQEFRYDSAKEPLPVDVELTFYLPKHVQKREKYGCAAFEARGYFPIVLRSQTVRLPTLAFVSFDHQHSDRPRP